MRRQKSFQNKQPTLYLVPTPIGNLQEMTPRALQILNQVDAIAAEDTRNTHKLCQAYGIQKPLLSHHEHNQGVSIPQILARLEGGEDIAVVSDAGYPLVSDPGQRLVKEAIENNFNVVSLSGANAATNALVASGLSTEHYLFYGFLDNKSGRRKKQLEGLKDFPYTMIFYEAPHRIEDMLQDCLDVLGNRNIVLARELTKLYEEYIRGTIQEVLEIASSLKGEMVVLIEGKVSETKAFDMEGALKQVQTLIDGGMKTKEAIKRVAQEMNGSKNELYDAYHKQMVI